MKPPSDHAIILFDGVCNLCNVSVDFVIDRDPAGYFQFASQQSPAGQELLQRFGLSTRSIQSIVLIDRGRSYTRSEAALRVAAKLSGPARLLSLGIVIPSFLRDMIYDFVARRRYRWFGRTETCRIPSNELKSRFNE